MTALQILSSQPLSGKTAIAAALGQRFALDGGRVRLLRAGGGAAALADAETFAALTFASSPGRPVAADQVDANASDETVLLELDAAAPPVAHLPGLIVVRGAAGEADAALARSLGDRLVGTIATRVTTGRSDAVEGDLSSAGLRPLAVLPEDRILAAPCVDELRDALGASLLYDGENGREVVEDVLIAPVYADPAQPHFQRFQAKAVLAPFNKTDLHLAAIETQAACLIITGGNPPSPYVVDRAQGENTTVLLAEEETPATLASLSDVWLVSRFRGERKTAAAFALLEQRLDFAALAAKLAGDVKGSQATGKIHSLRTFEKYTDSVKLAGEWGRERH